jgi:hypothetical protein
MTTCLESTGAAKRRTFVKNAQKEAYSTPHAFPFLFQSRKQESQCESVFSFFFWSATTVYDIYVSQQFSYYPRHKREKKRRKSIIQQRCRLARIRLETFYLYFEVPNLRVRIAQLGVEPIIIIQQSRSGSRSFAVLQTTKNYDQIYT